MPIINRSLSDKNCQRAKDELAFLVGHLARFRGELAIEFRGPSELSVYDRGFRLAQIAFGPRCSYRVSTHRRFIGESARHKVTPLHNNPQFPDVGDPNDSYATFHADARSIRTLLQMKHIAAMRSRIKEISHREEIGVSHFIAADTMSGTDVVVIDREVGDSAPEHRGERLDLLALREAGQQPGTRHRDSSPHRSSERGRAGQGLSRSD